MSSVASSHESGEQIDLGRENWRGSQMQEICRDAIEDPEIGPERVVAFMLHEGFGLSLDLVAKATGVTKSMVHKRIISARKRIAAKQTGLAAA